MSHNMKKPMYLCYAAYSSGCCTIMSNNEETITEHFTKVHGWTAEECREYFTEEEEVSA